MQASPRHVLGAEGALKSACRDLTDPILFLSSGGSALELLPALTSVLAKQSAQVSVSVSVLDERLCADSSIQNSAAVRRLLPMGIPFLSPLAIASNPTLKDATHFESLLRDWRAQNPNGKIIATMGIGPDGHTAGIFPCSTEEEFSSAYNMPTQWVSVRTIPTAPQCPLRLTVTVPFLCEQVDQAIVFLKGKEKGIVLQQLQSNTAPLYLFPAGVVHLMKNVSVFAAIVDDGGILLG